LVTPDGLITDADGNVLGDITAAVVLDNGTLSLGQATFPSIVTMQTSLVEVIPMLTPAMISPCPATTRARKELSSVKRSLTNIIVIKMEESGTQNMMLCA
jgi:hypothetical protein